MPPDTRFFSDLVTPPVSMLYTSASSTDLAAQRGDQEGRRGHEHGSNEDLA